MSADAQEQTGRTRMHVGMRDVRCISVQRLLQQSQAAGECCDPKALAAAIKSGGRKAQRPEGIVQNMI